MNIIVIPIKSAYRIKWQTLSTNSNLELEFSIVSHYLQTAESKLIDENVLQP